MDTENTGTHGEGKQDETPIKERLTRIEERLTRIEGMLQKLMPTSDAGIHSVLETLGGGGPRHPKPPGRGGAAGGISPAAIRPPRGGGIADFKIGGGGTEDKLLNLYERDEAFGGGGTEDKLMKLYERDEAFGGGGTEDKLMKIGGGGTGERS